MFIINPREITVYYLMTCAQRSNWIIGPWLNFNYISLFEFNMFSQGTYEFMDLKRYTPKNIICYSTSRNKLNENSWLWESWKICISYTLLYKNSKSGKHWKLNMNKQTKPWYFTDGTNHYFGHSISK